MIEAVAVIVREAGKLLVIRRAVGIARAGFWGFVGGGIEPGESQAQAARREFLEEVGGHAEPLEKVWEFARPGAGLLVHCWSARIDDTPLTPDPREVAEIRWCTPAEIQRFAQVLDSTRSFLAALELDQVRFR